MMIDNCATYILLLRLSKVVFHFGDLKFQNSNQPNQMKGLAQAVCPEKNRQVSIKVAQE